MTIMKLLVYIVRLIVTNIKYKGRKFQAKGVEVIGIRKQRPFYSSSNVK